MPHIEWTDELEIGINVIDGQHRRIVDYINRLYELGDDPDRGQVAEIIELMVDYTLSHFAFEEALMEEAGYQYLHVHQNTHRSFTDRITGLRERFGKGEEVAKDLADLLNAWLLNHIISDDISYASQVKTTMLGIDDQREGNWVSTAVARFFRK